MGKRKEIPLFLVSSTKVVIITCLWYCLQRKLVLKKEKPTLTFLTFKEILDKAFSVSAMLLFNILIIQVYVILIC